jgi:hypothetical protein
MGNPRAASIPRGLPTQSLLARLALACRSGIETRVVGSCFLRKADQNRTFAHDYQDRFDDD